MRVLDWGCWRGCLFLELDWGAGKGARFCGSWIGGDWIAWFWEYLSDRAMLFEKCSSDGECGSFLRIFRMKVGRCF